MITRQNVLLNENPGNLKPILGYFLKSIHPKQRDRAGKMQGATGSEKLEKGLETQY